MEQQEIQDFVSLDLSDEMQAALKAAGYETPSPIQAGLIPLAMEEVDVVGQARTGTGKTAAYAIPILELLDLDDTSGNPQALVLVPTRELAVQVKQEVDKLSKGLPVSCAAIYGGTPVKRQITQLKSGVHIVVGTPGRVIDHMSRRTVSFENVACMVLDEADRMLDVGFRPDIEKILRRVPNERQTLLLSATMPPPVRRLAEKYMTDPTVLNFSESDMTVETIEQHYFSVDNDRKFELLVKLMTREKPRQAIIFCRTKRGTQRTFEKLQKTFPSTACMHGDMQQRDRDRVMGKFRSEDLQFMVATDVMGRGIDISGISHIVNFDIPAHSDDYVHRVGRTGRMGRDGVAFTFVTPIEGEELTKIEQRIDRLLIRDEMEGMELTAHHAKRSSTIRRNAMSRQDSKKVASSESIAAGSRPRGLKALGVSGIRFRHSRSAALAVSHGSFDRCVLSIYPGGTYSLASWTLWGRYILCVLRVSAFRNRAQRDPRASPQRWKRGAAEDAEICSCRFGLTALTREL